MVLRIGTHNSGKHYQKQKSLEKNDCLLSSVLFFHFLSSILKSFISHCSTAFSCRDCHRQVIKCQPLSHLPPTPHPHPRYHLTSWRLCFSGNIFITWLLRNHILSPTCFLCVFCWLLFFLLSSQLARLTLWPPSLATPTMWVTSYSLVALNIKNWKYIDVSQISILFLTLTFHLTSKVLHLTTFLTTLSDCLKCISSTKF